MASIPRKPRFFVGSAKESLAVVDALEEGLRDILEIYRWDLDLFRPGHFTLEELTRFTSEADFAAFVLGREDLTVSKGHVEQSPRDNVIFEAGLFTAVLGSSRTFYVVDRQGTKIPSDWSGLSYLTYDGKEQRARDQVFDAVKGIKKAVEDMELRSRHGPLAGITGHWWQFVLNMDQGAVLSLMEIKSDPSRNSPIRLEGRAWSKDGELLARYRSCAAEFDERSRTLFYYWAGEHPRERSVPQFFGVGEITFSAVGTQPVTAAGFYSESNRSQLNATHTRSTEFKRATPEELGTLEHGDRCQRSSLIQSKLSERSEGNV